MSDRRIDAFFYGLFMDTDTLKQNGVEAVNTRRAFVADFALRIGRRATLIPSIGHRAYGVIMSLTHGDLARLYNAPGLEHYRPESVLAQTLDGSVSAALCYNLLESPAADERNPEYAARLQRVLQKWDFPPEYVASVC